MSTFYTYGDTLIANTLARSADLKAEFQAIEGGFDMLPEPTEIKLGTVQWGTDTGAANAYVVALPYAPAAYVAGLIVRFKPDNTNTGASTVNVNALGVKAIKRPNGDALQAGDIDADAAVELVYDGTNFIVMHTLVSIVDLAETERLAAAAEAVAAAASAIDAAASAAAALVSENNAATSYDSFDDRFLGAKASDPSTDNDGNALVTGAIYWNTATSKMKVYTGSAWANGLDNAVLETGASMAGDIDLNNNDLLGAKTVGFEAEYANTTLTVGATVNVTLTNGQKQNIQLGGTGTIALVTTGAPVGHYQLRLYNNGTGGYSVTWTGINSDDWLGTTAAPSINGVPNGETIINFYWNGTALYGAAGRVGMA